MEEQVTGTVLLCDYANLDRGKLNVLGGGWTRCGAHRNPIYSVIAVEMPGSVQGQTLAIELKVYEFKPEVSQDKRLVGSSRVEGAFSISAGQVAPPSYTVHLPLPVDVELLPSSAYVVEMSVNSGEPLAYAAFETYAESTDDE